MSMRVGYTLPPAAAPIPLLDVVKAIPQCFRNDSVTGIFEEEIQKSFAQRYCCLTSSGKASLFLILKALKSLYPERDEVVIPAFTCYSVPAAIKKAGMVIRLCDMEHDSLDMDKEQLKDIIARDNKKKNILCILVTHLFGCPADVDGIRKITGEQIPIVEDAAQAMGEVFNGKKIGTQADAGFFSLGRGKALSTAEGGIIVTNRGDLTDALHAKTKTLDVYSVNKKIMLAAKTLLTTLLQNPFLFWLPKMLPFLRLGETIYEDDFPVRRMSSFQRGLARNWQERLETHRKARKKNMTFWDNCLPEKLSVACLRQKGCSMIRLPVLARNHEEQNALYRKSEKKGWGIMPTYPTPINRIPELSKEFAGQQFPNATRLADCLLTLPVHDYVRERDLKSMCNEI